MNCKNCNYFKNKTVFIKRFCYFSILCYKLSDQAETRKQPIDILLEIARQRTIDLQHSMVMNCYGEMGIIDDNGKH